MIAKKLPSGWYKIQLDKNNPAEKTALNYIRSKGYGKLTNPSLIDHEGVAAFEHFMAGYNMARFRLPRINEE